MLSLLLGVGGDELSSTEEPVEAECSCLNRWKLNVAVILWSKLFVTVYDCKEVPENAIGSHKACDQ